jgi:hypothetical protein
MVRFSLRLLCHHNKCPWYLHWIRGRMGPRSRSGCYEEKELLLLRGIEPTFLGCPARSAVIKPTELSSLRECNYKTDERFCGISNWFGDLSACSTVPQPSTLRVPLCLGSVTTRKTLICGGHWVLSCWISCPVLWWKLTDVSEGPLSPDYTVLHPRRQNSSSC